MKQISSTEAKTHFGALLDMAQREPVMIHKKGRAVEQRFTALADNPLTGIARADLRPEGLRSIADGSHVVFY